MEKATGLNIVRIDSQKDQEIQSIANLEKKLKNESGLQDSRDMFNYILFRVYGIAPQNVKRRGMDYYSKWEPLSMQDLLDSFKERLKSEKRRAYFSEWLELIKKTGRLEGEVRGGGSSSLSTIPKLEKPIDDSIERRIALAQEQRGEIENDLKEALFSQDFGLEVKTTRDKWGWPQYSIFSKTNPKIPKILGIIRFSINHENGEEKNILEFVNFRLGDAYDEGRVAMILSNLEKDKIERFAHTVLLALGGKRSEVAMTE